MQGDPKFKVVLCFILNWANQGNYSVVPALGRYKQDQEPKAILGYIMSLKPVWTT